MGTIIFFVCKYLRVHTYALISLPNGKKMSDTCDITEREIKISFSSKIEQLLHTRILIHTNYFLLCPMQLYYLIDRIWQAKCY